MEKDIKKSAVDLTDLALGIIVLGIIVSIGATILVSYRDSRLTNLATVTTNNESGLFVNATGHTLANTWGKSLGLCFGNYTGTGNVAANTSIPSSNITATLSTSGQYTLTNATASTYTDVACTYNWYNTSRADWTVTDKAATGLTEYGNWFKILVIVGVAAVVLSLIFLAFGNRGSQEGGQAY